MCSRIVHSATKLARLRKKGRRLCTDETSCFAFLVFSLHSRLAKEKHRNSINVSEGTIDVWRDLLWKDGKIRQLMLEKASQLRTPEWSVSPPNEQRETCNYAGSKMETLRSLVWHDAILHHPFDPEAWEVRCMAERGAREGKRRDGWRQTNQPWRDAKPLFKGKVQALSRKAIGFSQFLFRQRSCQARKLGQEMIERSSSLFDFLR